MIRPLELEHLHSETTALRALLERAPSEDLIGRISLTSRLSELDARIAELKGRTENHAAVAVFFAGKPVIGSNSIEAGFATTAISWFSDIVTKEWANAGGTQLHEAPVSFKDSPQLYITNIAHGSFGFVLEEMDETERMFPSPLKLTVDRVTEVLQSFGSEDEAGFQSVMEEVHPKVFSAIRQFFATMHREEALLRVVNGTQENRFDRESVERAYQRAESSTVNEDERVETGELLGVIPVGRRFEFRTNKGQFISGRVASSLSESYLERIEKEQLVGKIWKAKLRYREVTRFDKRRESCMLLDLSEVST